MSALVSTPVVGESVAGGRPTGGDPAAAARAGSAARAMADRLRLLAEGMEAAAAAWPEGDAVPGWQGVAAETVAQLLAVRPDRFRAVAAAGRGAADALARHAEALEPVIALKMQAAQAPADLVVGLERRADDLAAVSAHRTAGALLGLADSAPPPPGTWTRRLRQADSWRSELQLGAAESTEALVNTVGQVAGRLIHPVDGRVPGEVRQFVAGAEAAARHPLAVLKSALDWDTWRTNPARAAGHLVPDVVAAVASGGTAASARAVTVAGRTRAAVEAVAVRDRLRRDAAATAATASRQALVRRAQAVQPAPTGGLGWLGPGGARLTPGQNASAEAFHALSAVDEPTVTAAMHAAVVAGRGRLAGLDQRLKPSESYKLKLATAHARTGTPLPDLLAGAKDSMRYTAVLDDTNYARGVADIATALEQRGFHVQSAHNAWLGPRYRGFNSHWLNPDTGAAFEVQFHTPASWLVTKQTHTLYEEYRLPTVSPVRQAELHELIAAQYRQVPIPGWVQNLSDGGFPPPTRPAPIVPPVDYTLHAAAVGSVVTGLGVAAPRVEADTRSEVGTRGEDDTRGEDGTRSEDREDRGGHSRTP